MSASDVARQIIDGQQAAERALRDLAQGVAPPDLLHDRLQAVLAAQQPVKLRAWCRELQKRIELAGA